jgi:acyl transferase domain-containing protein
MYGKYPVLVGGDYSVPNRISFEYDLRGPSVSIRTACSSTMVALTEACSAITGGECDAAIVGVCQFILSPTVSTIMSTRGVLSHDGICKSFDAAADGYGRREAINEVYLKPLDSALRDRILICGIIRSSVVNSDGKTAGFSVPSTEAQEALIRKAYRIAEINDYCQTAFIECHGTGTSVGDPIEASTIARMYEGHEICIGSVKPNLGHSEGASGLTSFMKTIMAVEKGIVPLNISFKNPNPKIPFSEGGLTVPTEPIPWPPNRHLRAGINCFGMCGVNTHAVIESARSLTPQLSPSSGSRSGPSLLLFSANTKEYLAQAVEKNHEYLESHPQALSDLTYTLGARRAHPPFRAFSAVSEDGTIETFPHSQVPEQRPDVVMVFTGQGAQLPGMGVQLYEINRAFRESLREAQRVLQELPEAP